jgi:hypothetical protein
VFSLQVKYDPPSHLKCNATFIIDDIQYSRKSWHDQYKFRTVPFILSPKIITHKVAIFQMQQTDSSTTPPWDQIQFTPNSGGSHDQLQAGSLLHKRKEPGNEVVMINNWLINLVPLACGPQEGMWGSGIIRLRDESDWPLIWNAQFDLSQDSWLPATDYPRASRSFEDHRLGERDCWLIRLIKQHWATWATLTANDFVTH